MQNHNDHSNHMQTHALVYHALAVNSRSTTDTGFVTEALLRGHLLQSDGDTLENTYKNIGLPYWKAERPTREGCC